MKIFRDLELSGPNATLLRAIEVISSNLADGWTRANEIESEFSSVGGETMFCFFCSGTADRQEAALWMTFGEETTTLYVSNIVPKQLSELNFDQYNTILCEFYERFAKPAAEALRLQHVMTPDTKDIEDLLSENTASKLRAFSKLANKATGSAHPYDRARWFDFLVASHSESSRLDSHTLARWLVESEKWSEEKAADLAIEYEFAIALLNFYNERC